MTYLHLCRKCEAEVYSPEIVESALCKDCFEAEKAYKTDTILDTAAKLVDNGEREQEYGPTARSFSDIAKGWSLIISKDITAEQVGLCMIWLKIVRECAKHKRDNLVDIAGYARCIERITS